MGSKYWAGRFKVDALKYVYVDIVETDSWRLDCLCWGKVRYSRVPQTRSRAHQHPGSDVMYELQYFLGNKLIS